MRPLQGWSRQLTVDSQHFCSGACKAACNCSGSNFCCGLWPQVKSKPETMFLAKLIEFVDPDALESGEGAPDHFASGAAVLDTLDLEKNKDHDQAVSAIKAR